MSTTSVLILLGITLLGSISLFILLSIKIKKRGGSFTSMLYGSTYEFYDHDKRNSIKEVVEEKAAKKRKEQGSKEPDEDSQENIDANEIYQKLYPKK